MTSNGRKPRKVQSTSNSKSPVGEVLLDYLASSGVTQASLAGAIGKSSVYTNHIIAGRKPASPEWCDLVSNAMNLDQSQTYLLHEAAARGLGYKLDFTKK